MNTILVAAVAIAIVTGVLLYAVHRHGLKERKGSGQIRGIPQGKEESFAHGTHPGEDGVPVMYTLTTCRHCVHLKKFLDKHGIVHHLVYVDDFTEEARTGMMAVLRAHNPRGSFPTFVMPGGRTIVGFKEQELRKAYNLPPQNK